MATATQATVHPLNARQVKGRRLIGSDCNRRATSRIAAGETVQGLHLADMALGADADNTMALEARLAAFETLEAKCTNAIEHGWLRYGIRMTQKRLGK